MPALVMLVIDPFVTSEAVRVCVPTVPSVTLNWCVPFDSVPVSGVFAAPSLEVMRTLSAAGTTFHQLSVPFTVTGNERPALWVAGDPVRPDTLPGSGFCPGTTIWRRAKVPGCTVNGSL